MQMRQRGFFGLSLIASAIIGLVGLVAIGAWIAFVWHAIDSTLEHHYVDPQRVIWDRERKLIEDERDAAKGNYATVSAANVILQGRFQQLDAERQACSAEVDRLARIKGRIDAARAVRQPIDDAALAQIKVDQINIFAKMNAPAPPNDTCEAERARRDAFLRKVAEERMRDFPRTEGDPAPSPARDALRIEERRPK